MKLIANMFCRRRLKLQTRMRRWLLKMLKGKMKILSLAIIMMAMFSVLCAAEEKGREEGLFSEGSFLSEAINSAADKINKVTSGQERIVDNDAKGVDKGILEYDADPLGKPNVAWDRAVQAEKHRR